MAATMLRWIAFDAVGTLISPEPSVAAAYHEAAQRFGSRLGLDEIRRRFRAAFQASERDDSPPEDGASVGPFATTERHEAQRWRRIVARVVDDAADPAACFDALWRHFASPAHWRSFPEVASVLERLHRQGVGLAIASNFDARLHAVCDGLPALRRIRQRVVSSEVGFRKPSPRFYAELVRRLGCRSDEVLMVGDDWTNDVAAARRAGLAAAFLDRAGSPGNGEDSDRPDVLQLSSLEELAERFASI